jgi:hypothetical protein
VVRALQQVPHAFDRAARRDVPQVRAGRRKGTHPGDDAAGHGGARRRPWHLKLLLLAAAIYLGFRFWQMSDWFISWLQHR